MKLIFKRWPWGEIDVMACKCKNFDGTPASMCMGMCVAKEAVEVSEEMQRRDPLNGFTEVIMSQVSQMIASEINKFQLRLQKEHFETYREAFLAGIKEGIELGREIYV